MVLGEIETCGVKQFNLTVLGTSVLLCKVSLCCISCCIASGL